MLEEPPSLGEGLATRKAKIFYSSCMNTSELKLFCTIFYDKMILIRPDTGAELTQLSDLFVHRSKKLHSNIATNRIIKIYIAKSSYENIEEQI